MVIIAQTLIWILCNINEYLQLSLKGSQWLSKINYLKKKYSAYILTVDIFLKGLEEYKVYNGCYLTGQGLLPFTPFTITTLDNLTILREN